VVFRLSVITFLVAVFGSVLSGLAALRVYDQELTVDRIALSRAIDVHASLVQERMTERELLARVASGLFRSPSIVAPNMLQPLSASMYAFKTDFVTMSFPTPRPRFLPPDSIRKSGIGKARCATSPRYADRSI
jgi:hypothetical protein